MRCQQERSGSLFSYVSIEERQLLEQLNYNLLHRWFEGLSPDDPIWSPTTFTKNRGRLLNEQVMDMFLKKLMGAPEIQPLLSDEHFWVAGTLLQAWASHASLKRINGQDDFPPKPSAPKRTTTPRDSWLRCDGSASRRMWPGKLAQTGAGGGLSGWLP